ncbi:hypothetical protein EDB19DRAFT_1904546 [Suillus lakei]|nr:hypothetical protein EDB19DRAFT_1904546 [Suillus lakei]
MESGTLDNSDYPKAIVDDEPQTITPSALDELNAVSPLLTPLELPILPELLAFRGQLSDQYYRPLESARVMGPLPEDVDPPFGQLPQDLLRGTSSSMSYELSVQPFLHQHGTYSEGRTLSGSSARRDQSLPSPIVQCSQDKVKCTWPGCSKFVKKDNRTRHVNETHLRKVKAVCAGCGKRFTRPYLRRDHICPAEM